ncbi:MAG: hypothetical protein JW940_21865 [Polyangiaceae bacterium]|nr:hypothetical protein [Polyangiaceae bacterium]
MPSRKLAARGSEPDCPTEVMPLGSSSCVDWAADPRARLAGEREDGSHPVASQHTLPARDLGAPGVGQPSSEHPPAGLDAAMRALDRVIAELMTPADSIDPKRATLCAELEAVLEALTAAAEHNQSARRHCADLEAALDGAREEAENRERALMEQQDGVLEALLTEHERQTQALEHELQIQRQYATSLRRELDEKAELLESLEEQQKAPPHRAPTPKTWPPNDAEPPDATKSYAPAPGRPSVARLVADRDHLLASLRLLKRQRDDAQQETLDLVEQLAAANNEIESLRALLPGVSAPPVPSSRRAETTARPPAPALAHDQPTRKPEAELASTQPPPVSGSTEATPVTRASRRPTLPPAQDPIAPEDHWAHDASAVAIPEPLRDALSQDELLRTPSRAPPLRTMTRPGPAGYHVKSERLPMAPADVSGPPPSPRGAAHRAAAEALLSDRKPPLKRKPDPTQSPLGTYSLTRPVETESLHTPNRGSGRPSDGRRR